MIITREDINSAGKIFRLNLINSITGIKPANLIGTVSAEGNENLAIVSSVIHIGSNPPYIGFISRPDAEVKRHTLANIKNSGMYSINHLPRNLTENGHWTSAKFEDTESEFEYCGFTPAYEGEFPAPFVGESSLAVGMKLVEIIPIPLNDTRLVIGEVLMIRAEEGLVSSEGYIDLEQAGSCGISGLNSYYSFEKIGEYPYARRKDVPDFGDGN